MSREKMDFNTLHRQWLYTPDSYDDEEIVEVHECPFCCEEDFDLVALKIHLLNSCDEFRKISIPKKLDD